MRPIRRASFAANALKHKPKPPETAKPSKPRKRRRKFNWDAVTAIATALSVLVTGALLYAAIRAFAYTETQIYDSRKQAQAGYLIEEKKEFYSPEFRAVRKRLAEIRLNSSRDDLNKLDPEDYPLEMNDELSFCNDLGILTRHGELSPYDIWGVFSPWIFPFYADAEPIIKADQKDYPASWSNCVFLIDEVRKVDVAEDSGKQLKQGNDEIIDFYNAEIDVNKTRSTRGAK